MYLAAEVACSEDGYQEETSHGRAEQTVIVEKEVQPDAEMLCTDFDSRSAPSWRQTIVVVQTSQRCGRPSLKVVDVQSVTDEEVAEEG